MKKLIKFLSVMIAIFVVAVEVVQNAEAVWPPVLRDQFFQAYCADAAVATYCFFNPDKERDGSANGLSMAHPRLFCGDPETDSDPETIPVAICLWTEKAKDEFNKYFVKKHSKRINEVLFFGSNKYENVFIISYKDLICMANEQNIILYTKNGISGEAHDVCWSWRRVMWLSSLTSSWGIVEIPAPKDEFLKKARVLIDGLKAGKFGSTIRVYKSSDVVETFWASMGWTGEEEFIGPPIIKNLCVK